MPTAPSHRKMALAALLVVIPLILLSPAAMANRTQESIFQDDSLITAGPEKLDELKGLGVDTIHFLVNWKDLAPRASSKRRPRGFRGTSPTDYASSKWDKYDNFIRAATDRGFRLLATPNGPAPRWAVKKRGKGGLSSYRPRAKWFGRFVLALGKRYNGSWQDEDSSGTLPRISFWSFFNEPNQGGWLQPQSAFSKTLGRRIPVAPHIYRRLYQAGYRNLRRSGHRGDEIALGELAPIGSSDKGSTRPLAPGLFLRELFCLDGNLRRFRGIEAKVRGCQSFKKLKGTSFAHHPYMKSFAATTAPRNRDWMPIGAFHRLEKLLDRAASRGRVSRRIARKIYVTEFGVQSNPPDKIAGISLSKQARYINEGEYLAYKRSRIRSWAQFALEDDPVSREYSSKDPRRYGGFQTGLKFEDGTAKPAYDAYRLPIFVKRIRSNKVRVWGLVRPLTDTSAGPRTIQIESGKWGSFDAVGGPTTISSSRGYFQKTITGSGVARTRWRFAWVDGAGATHYSRSAKPRRK